MLTITTAMLTNFLFNPMFLLGYAVCVLFPLPWLNSAIISLWAKFGSKIVETFKSVTGGKV